MKRLLLYIFLFLLPFTADATHFMGGEITWECLPNGRYRFTLSVYRECYTQSGGNAAQFGAITNLHASGGGVTTIQMHRLPGYPIDMSPKCNPDTSFPHLQCPGMSNGAANMGALQEHVYTSDVAFPAGVQLTGIPPPNGWTFAWGTNLVSGICCRNPSTNVLNALSVNWWLRAKMYNYNNQNVYPCFDSSPQFVEIPNTVLCSGYPFKYHPTAYDEENDSLSYEWGEPMLSGNTPITQYAPGYHYTSPLPNSMQNPNNVGATINPESGIISFTSFTNGAFVTCVKVTAWKNNVRVAEIWREMQVVLIPCQTNNPPSLPGPFADTSTTQTYYTDTVYAGQYVSFPISVTDFEFLPNMQPQTVTLEAFGQQFGDGFTSISDGCFISPCATLNPPPPLTAIFAVQTNFVWQTDCAHLPDPTAGGGGGNYNIFDFIFKTYDDFCPVPAMRNEAVRIVVVPHPNPPQPQPPKINCVNALPNGDVTIYFDSDRDSISKFVSTHVYAANSPSGPFTMIDSIIDPLINSYTHTGAAVGNQPLYYFLRKRTSYCWTQMVSDPGDTLRTIVLNATINVSGGVDLNWNKIHPKFTTTDFIIHRAVNSGSWITLDTVATTSWHDPDNFCDDTLHYYLTAITDSCYTISNVFEIIVYNIPAVSIGYPKTLYCENEPPQPLTLTPSGGSLTGSGCFGSTFYPQLSNTGPVLIRYNYTNSLGCSNSDSVWFYVQTLPQVFVGGIDSTFCHNDPDTLISVMPTGGNLWSPTATITNQLFSASQTSPGYHKIYYQFTDSIGCTNTDSIRVLVRPPDQLSFSGIPPLICDNSPPFIIQPQPTGGVFTGTAMTSNVFSPLVAGAGIHAINYASTNQYGCVSDSSILLTVHPSPQPILTPSQTSVCENGGVITLSGTPSGGTFYGTGVSGNIFNPSVAGVGSFMLSYNYIDPIGCENTATTSVIVHPVPLVTLSGLDTAYCPNAYDVILLGQPSGGQFSSPSATLINNIFSPSQTTSGYHTIYYDYSDANNCHSGDSFTVYVRPNDVLTVSGIPALLCDNHGPITLQANPPGGVFSGNAVSADLFIPSVAGAGNHNVNYSYTNQYGCVSDTTVVITVHPKPQVSLSISQPAFCVNGLSMLLTVSPPGGVITGPGVSGNVFDPALSGVGSFLIEYFYTDTIGCSNADTELITVHPTPIVEAGPDTSKACLDSAIVIGGLWESGVNYQWFPAQGLSSDIIPRPSATPNMSTLYRLTGINQFGCIDTSYAYISINDAPPVNLGSDTILCYGDSLELDAGSTAVSYLWNTGEQSRFLSVSPSQQTVYIVTISDGDCLNSDTIEISIARPIVMLGNDTLLCTGDTLMLDAGDNESWLWHNGDTSRFFAAVSDIPLTTGKVFSVTVSDKHCYASDSILIRFYRPTVNLGQDTSICRGELFFIDLGNSFTGYLWHDGSTNFYWLADTSMPAGVYQVSVIVTDNAACSNSDSIQFTVIDCPPSAVSTENWNVKIYPNPNKGKFDIMLVGAHPDLTVNIINAGGKLVKSLVIPASNTSAIIPSNVLGNNTGVFFIEVISDKKKMVERVVVE